MTDEAQSAPQSFSTGILQAAEEIFGLWAEQGRGVPEWGVLSIAAIIEKLVSGRKVRAGVGKFIERTYKCEECGLEQINKGLPSDWCACGLSRYGDGSSAAVYCPAHWPK